MSNGFENEDEASVTQMAEWWFPSGNAAVFMLKTVAAVVAGGVAGFLLTALAAGVLAQVPLLGFLAGLDPATGAVLVGWGVGVALFISPRKHDGSGWWMRGAAVLGMIVVPMLASAVA